MPSCDEPGRRRRARRLAGRDGAALETAFDDIAAKAVPFVVEPGDYPELFGVAIDDRVVRRPGTPDSRIRIYGPLEARLTGVDRVVIGGLVEGIWPPDPRTDPWLSRPMRHAVGLDLPERRIGLSAHDFAQLMGAGEVFLTRSAKLAGAPDGGVALRAAPRGGGGGGAVAGGGRARRALPPSRPQPRPAHGTAAAGVAPAAAAAARGAADAAFGHRDRALAARSLHHLCQAHPQAAAARPGRRAARRRRSRQRHPCRRRRIHQALCRPAARRSLCGADPHRPHPFRPARRLPGDARLLVAAL